MNSEVYLTNSTTRFCKKGAKVPKKCYQNWQKVAKVAKKLTFIELWTVQLTWPETVLPDLAKSCQSSKKVLQEMAKCGQGSQSYTLYTICFTLYALHFTLYTLRFRLKCILGRSVFCAKVYFGAKVSNGDKLRWPKSVRPNCHLASDTRKEIN